jgi:hypothetical protein
MHDKLHWLDVRDRINFRLCVTVYKCLHGTAPAYLSEHCIPTASLLSRQRLRASSNDQLIVPTFRRSTYGSRSFAVAGPAAWNALPSYLRESSLSLNSFKSQLKTFLFARY